VVVATIFALLSRLKRSRADRRVGCDLGPLNPDLPAQIATEMGRLRYVRFPLATEHWTSRDVSNVPESELLGSRNIEKAI
jgi:hypothetical protein